MFITNIEENLFGIFVSIKKEYIELKTIVPICDFTEKKYFYINDFSKHEWILVKDNWSFKSDSVYICGGETGAYIRIKDEIVPIFPYQILKVDKDLNTKLI